MLFAKYWGIVVNTGTVSYDRTLYEIEKLCVVMFMQVKWMMYWVVYAFFVSVEVVADIFIVW